MIWDRKKNKKSRTKNGEYNNHARPKIPNTQDTAKGAGAPADVKSKTPAPVAGNSAPQRVQRVQKNVPIKPYPQKDNSARTGIGAHAPGKTPQKAHPKDKQSNYTQKNIFDKHEKGQKKQREKQVSDREIGVKDKKLQGENIPKNSNDNRSKTYKSENISQKPQRIKKKISPEQEAEIKKRLAEKRKLEERQRIIAEKNKKIRREISKAKRKVFLARTLMSLIMYVFILIIITTYFFASGFGEKKEDPYYITVETGTVEKVQRKYVSSDTVFYGRDYTPYINISDLADFCGLSVIGDYKTQMRFIIKDNPESFIVVNRNSTAAAVNSVPVRLTEPAVFSGGRVFLPLDFFECYTQGIDFTYDKASNKISALRTIDEENSNEYKNEYESFAFVMQGANPHDKIKIPEQ